MTNEQHTSRQYINLDWADVEAWVKSNPRTNPHPRLPGRYVTRCPVRKHQSQSNDLSVWKRDDGSIGLTCRGNCTYRAMLEAIAEKIKPSTAPDTEPPFVQARTAPQLEVLEQALADTNAKHAQELERALADTNAKHAQELERALANAQERAMGGTLLARQEERDKAESQISGLRQDLKNAQAQHKRSQEKLRADNETLQKQLAAATPEVMNDAWRHIRNGEPLAAYREAMAILESKLRDVLGNPRKPTSSQELDLYPLMEMAATKGHINGKQLDHLDLMRERRNSFAHNSEEKVRKSKNPLTESEARATVAYLGQVIDQPEA